MKPTFALFALLAGGALLWTQTRPASADKTVSITEWTNLAVAVSADRSTIVVDLQGSLWSLSFRGGVAKRLTDPMLEPARPDYSPKGDLIAFQAGRNPFR